MASRVGLSSRASGRSGRGIGPPGLTKTQALRQAKSAAFVKSYKEKEREEQQAAAMPSCCRSRKPQASRPPPPPQSTTTAESAPGVRGTSIGRPGMTKAVLARMKHAQKFQQELEERKMREELGATRRKPVRRTGAARQRGPSSSPSRRRPRGPGRSANEEAAAAAAAMEEQQQQQEEERGRRARSSARPAGRRRAGAPIPLKTCQLARSIDADVIQAEPVGGGPVDSIVIPPGTVNEGRTTIISISQQQQQQQQQQAGLEVVDRSIRVLNDSLNEQDAVESAAVQDKLTELQQARREFVMAVANVSSSAATSPGQRRFIYDVPDITDERLQIKFGRDHPDVVAAREFAARSLAGCRQRESQQRMEREFRRFAREPLREDQDLRLDVPLEQELMEGDISFEEDDETGVVLPCPSRIKASMPRIPTRVEPYPYEALDVDELERFFDLRNYPPCLETAAIVQGPPPGRENLNPDLWYVDDPWYHPPPDGPDLIDFDS